MLTRGSLVAGLVARHAAFMSDAASTHCVAVIGGAVAGAEMAKALAGVGVEVVVFEQNPKPFGKIEDGLPRWHASLQEKEYARIVEGLSHPRVHFVPKTRVGDDLDFAGLVHDWGFTGVVLASGAWRDRPLPVEGADAYVDKGLIYQNPFIIWFNHADDPTYDGPVYTPEDGALVIGGGLASIDVCKALMVETTRAELKKRGIEVTMLELEHKGIPKVLEAHGMVFGDLGLEGCTLFYRRRAEDMPLMQMPEGADEKTRAKVRAGRQKILAKAMRKYLFHVEPLSTPDELVVEGDRAVGLKLRRTRIEGRRVVPTDETFERRGPYVISSIGSVPVPIEGVPMKGELYDFVDWNLGRLNGFPTVFSTGNVATGKGNIVASRKHAKTVASTLVEAFLGLGEGDEGAHGGEAKISDALHSDATTTAEEIARHITTQPAIAPDRLDAIVTRAKARQTEVGYDGNLEAWVEAHH